MPHGDHLLSALKPSDMSRGQLFALLFAFVLKHCITQSALGDLIMLMNVALPGCLPQNLYYFNKIADVSDTLQTHLFCAKCKEYVGLHDSDKKVCSVCAHTMDCKQSIRKGNFFLIYPLTNSLRAVLELHGMGQFLIDQDKHGNICHDGSSNICDISHGTLYCGRKNGPFPSSMSLSANVDGVPVFRSSKLCLWPLYYVINNLPIHHRRKHVILQGLWCGQNKPNMTSFLQPVVDELIALHNDGLSWQLSPSQSVKTVIYLDLMVADAVARPALQNFKQFNGEFGCNLCLHKGEAVDKGLGSVRVYPLQSDLPQPRCHEQTLQFAFEAEDTSTAVYGVKGPSVLCLVPNFNIVSGFNPEYMHCILLGVVRQFTSLWFDASSHGEKYSLRKHTADIDKIMLGVKPPSEVKRLPRLLSLRKYWKASEWRSFLLFHSVIALKPFMLPELYRHWLLLHFAVYNLMAKHVKRSHLISCDLALHKFVSKIPELYGRAHVSYNVHLLTHTVQAVEQWGPLWASSAFIFEDANRHLLRSLHGANSVSSQVFSNYIAARHLNPLAARYISASEDSIVIESFQKLSGLQVHGKTAVQLDSGIVGLGMRKPTRLAVKEILALESLLERTDLSDQVFAYKRILIGGTIAHTVAYSAAIKRADCFFTLKSHTGVFAMQRCIVFPDSSTMYFLFISYGSCQQRVYDVDINANLLQHVVKACKDRSHVIACTAADVADKVIALPRGRDMFFIALPQFELD